MSASSPHLASVAGPAAPTATELLAPAGDWESLRAAIANGADAVYFGLENYNARHRAVNFQADELPAILDYLHARGARGYVTLNTLIFSQELPEVARLVEAISQAGADAVIVQDWGLARLIHRLAPDLPIHGSTQMTLSESRGIERVRGLGVQRVILARELSLDDITRIAARSSIPVEVFVHGALCVAYSGQCLTSEALGARSANRGQCAQACRLPYQLVVDGQVRPLGDTAYLLSPQDLAAYDLVAPLVEAGVASLKIEGRLKSPHYVAAATQTYRASLDAALGQQPFEISSEQHDNLQQSFSRGFTAGFLRGVDHQQLVEGRSPKSRGTRLGTVVGTTRLGILVELVDGRADRVKPGDGLVLDEGHPEQDEQGGRVYEVLPAPQAITARPTPGTTSGTGEVVEVRFGRGQVNLAAVSPGSLVWKTDDPAIRRRLERSFAQEVSPRPVPLDIRLSGAPGQPLEAQFTAADGRVANVTWPGPLQLALKHPLDAHLAREQLGRLGESGFSLGTITLVLGGAVMVPKSVLNELRRQAVEALGRQTPRPAAPPRRHHPQALTELRREALASSAAGAPSSATEAALTAPRLAVLARSLAQVEALAHWQPAAPLARPALIYCDLEDPRHYRQAVDLARAGGLPIALATLRVLKPADEGWLAPLVRAEPDAVLIRNLAALDYFRREAPELLCLGDYSLNAANELSAAWLLDEGLARLVPSYDLNWEQLEALLGRLDPSRLEVVIHQHMPLFHMEHCVFAHLLSDGTDWRDCGRPCDRHRVELRDRVGSDLPLVADAGCRNTVFHSVAQSAAPYVPRMLRAGLRWFRVELLRESPAELTALVEHYGRVLAGLTTATATWRGLQVLTQLGVTRGTLDGE